MSDPEHMEHMEAAEWEWERARQTLHLTWHHCVFAE